MRDNGGGGIARGAGHGSMMPTGSKRRGVHVSSCHHCVVFDRDHRIQVIVSQRRLRPNGATPCQMSAVAPCVRLRAAAAQSRALNNREP